MVLCSLSTGLFSYQCQQFLWPAVRGDDLSVHFYGGFEFRIAESLTAVVDRVIALGKRVVWTCF